MVTELRDLVQPVECYTTTYTQDGRTIEVQHPCADPNCPAKG